MSLRSSYHIKISKLCGELNNEYKNNAIAKRIIQKIIIILKINKINVTNLNKHKFNNELFTNENIKIDLVNFKIYQSIKFQIINILKFLYHYFLNLYSLVINFFLEANPKESINFIFSGKNRINTYEYKKKLKSEILKASF